MTNIFTAISGQFSKPLVLGCFLPAAIFVILNMVFVLPLFPTEWPAWKRFRALDTQGVLTATFFTVLLTGLLYNLNITIIRFFEGYTWQHSWLGRRRTRYYRAQMRAAVALRAQVRELTEALEAEPAAGAPAAWGEQRRELAGRLGSVRSQLGQHVLDDFPISEDSVMPTRLGNVVRSFENYSRRQYGMAAITLWPRLTAKVHKDYAPQMDEAKVSLDFTLNCALLSLLMALLLLFVGLWYPAMLVAPRLWLAWLLKIAIFLLLAYAFYRASIGRADEWGNTVKGAFDLYRRDLLSQLGYKQAPGSLEEERALWREVSQQLIFGDRPGVRPPDFESPPTRARGYPETARLEVTRGLKPSEAGGVVEIRLRVVNLDEEQREVSDIVLSDAPPAGFEYLWDSAELDRPQARAAVAAAGSWEVPEDAPPVGRVVLRAERVDFEGVNPYRFYVGSLPYRGELILRYRAFRPAGGK